MIIAPTLPAFRRLARRGNVVPVFTMLPADLETPLGAFLKLSSPKTPAFLFESVEGEQHVARYSFVGAQPSRVLTGRHGRLTARGASRRPVPVSGDDYVTALRRWMRQYCYVANPQLPRFCGGLVGYVGYEVIAQWEPVPVPSCDALRLPDVWMMLADSLVIFDHARHQLLLVANAIMPPRATADQINAAYRRAVQMLSRMAHALSRPAMLPHVTKPAPRTPVRSNITQRQFTRMVERSKRYIRAGDIIQVVLSQRFARPTTAPPIQVYRALRALNPSPYMFYLQTGDCALIGSSPEMLVRLEERRMETRPIAGTRRRGKDAAEDARLAQELLRHPKERAEHLMLVDLGRNDLGRVAVPGSMATPEFGIIEKYSHVMHLVSGVVGTMARRYDAFDLLRAAFPAGTVTGAPKVRAMQIIAELEGTQRGPYAGCVGYIGFSGNMDTCITIRTILMQHGMAYVQAGAGIVADSKPAAEYRETVNKAAGMLQALDVAERGGASQ